VIVVCRNEACPHAADRDRPMKMVEEYDTHWLFVCLLCQNGRVVTKEKVGGTLGAGRVADGRRTMGKGF